MGNKLTRRRHVVDERYTRPQGLYQHRDVDHKKLRKLILDAKLAPCYPGGEESTVDLDECPICFLYYPSLNRSRCCMKGICTECFLQMKSPHSARPTQCPFCKTSNYAVEYRGAKTQEEKGIEQAEEQKVIEAKIRMRQQELQAEEERMQKRRDIVNPGPIPPSAEAEEQGHSNLNVMSDGEANVAALSLSSRSSTSQSNGVHDAHGSSGVTGTRSQPLHGRHNRLGVYGCAFTTCPCQKKSFAYKTYDGGQRMLVVPRDDDFDLDLEDIMVMEAIWLSIQDHGPHRIPTALSAGFDNSHLSGPGYGRRIQPSASEDNHESNISGMTLAEPREMIPSSSVTGGLACAIAALAERQVINVDNTTVRQSQQNHQIDTDPGESSLVERQEISHHNPAVEELSSSITYERRHGDTETEDQEPAYPDESKICTELEGERGSEVHAPESWIEVSLESGRALSPCVREESRGSMSDWMLDHSSEVVEVGTSFSSSIPSASDLPWEAPDIPQSAEISVDPVSFGVRPSVVPESFEEQMMLAMAISLVEAQARS